MLVHSAYLPWRHFTEDDEYDEAATVAVVATISDQSSVCRGKVC
jgi:hypothetical protein